jgi:hypothetical protein
MNFLFQTFLVLLPVLYHFWCFTCLCFTSIILAFSIYNNFQSFYLNSIISCFTWIRSFPVLPELDHFRFYQNPIISGLTWTLSFPVLPELDHFRFYLISIISGFTWTRSFPVSAIAIFPVSTSTARPHGDWRWPNPCPDLDKVDNSENDVSSNTVILCFHLSVSIWNRLFLLPLFWE